MSPQTKPLILVFGLLVDHAAKIGDRSVMLDPPRPLGFIFYGIILRVFDIGGLRLSPASLSRDCRFESGLFHPSP